MPFNLLILMSWANPADRILMTWEFIWAWIWLHKSDDLTATTNDCTVIFVAAAMEHLEEQALEFYSAEHSEKLKILKNRVDHGGL